jgi:protein-export membrane protein SecD
LETVPFLEIFPLIWLAVAVGAGLILFAARAERHVTWLTAILLLVAFAVWVDLPDNPGLRVPPNPANDKYLINRRIEVRQGLDLRGGLKVLLEADVPSDTPIPEGALGEAASIIENRIDSLGVVEPVVQTQGERRIIVELPGVDNPDEAVALIQSTALLEFVEMGYTPLPPGVPIRTDFKKGAEAASEGGTEEPVYHTVMTGDVIQSARVDFDPQTGTPVVAFTLTPEGSKTFGGYTSAHVGEYLGIVLDGVVVSSPRIQTAITQGSGVITGEFTVDEANSLAIKLRYGAFSVPLRVETTSTVGPTLGAISVQQSVRAGLIGVAVVLLFMLIYYRLPGLTADLALLVFALLNFAIFKLVPITLTLPAITGFLISVGTAVDGNILIFERMKEELRAGRRIDLAVRAGFDRAWTSIRDSNLSTIIICIVLYMFGSSFGAGAVRGFAVTLALGLVVNLFTAVTVTRTFMHFLIPTREEFYAERAWLLGV